MGPSFVLVMRHAEKPADPNDINLSPPGQTRAQKLATYIPATFGIPQFIFAAAVSNHSARPVQTVQPLSDATHVPIDAKIADGDYAKLAKKLLEDAKYSGQHGVVCWHHEKIPALVRALGAKSGFPDPWDPAVFNLILKLDYAAGQDPPVTKITEPF